MNDFQLSLLGLGIALVAGVFAHGKWQEHQQRKIAKGILGRPGGDALDRPVSPPRKAPEPEPVLMPVSIPVSAPVSTPESVNRPTDPLFGEQGQEEVAKPGFFTRFFGKKPASQNKAEPSFGAAQRIEPKLASDERFIETPGGGLPPRVANATISSNSSSAEAATKASPSRESIGEPDLRMLGPEADYIATFNLVEPVSGDVVEQIPHAPMSALRKRVAWVGFCETHHRWEFVTPHGSYRYLRLGVQLADRTGPLTSSLAEQFRLALELVGDALTAVPELPNARDSVVKAQRLDRLCAEVDIQVAVHLAPRHDHFSPDTVRDVALDTGFTLGQDGQLGYPDAAGHRQFVLHMPAKREADGLPAPTAVLMLEVPLVEHGEVAFERMMNVAQELADTLNGIVVDEHRRPITDRFVGPAREQIRQIQSKMSVQGVPPGSVLAHRLFS